MKKTKKIAAVLLAGVTTAALAAGLTACGDSGSAEEDTRDKDIVAVYNLYAASAGSDALTYDEWLQSITGAQGEKGDTGAAGKSAYDIWLEAGNEGSEADFLESLKGVGVEGIYETSEGTFVKYTDGTYQAIETGGVQHELLQVGENYIDTEAAPSGATLSVTYYSFYVLEEGAYTFTVYESSAGLAVGSTDFTISQDADVTSGTYGLILCADLDGPMTDTQTLKANYEYVIAVFNVASSDATYRITVEKVAE